MRKLAGEILFTVALAGIFVPGATANNSPRRKAAAGVQTDQIAAADYVRAVANDDALVKAAHARLDGDRNAFGPNSPEAKQDEINLTAARSMQAMDQKVLNSDRPR